MNKFSTFDATEILKINRGTFKSWLAEGFIEPTLKTEDGKGPGQKSKFDIFQLYLIRLFQIFLHHGIARKQAKALIERIQESKTPEKEERVITVYKGRDLPTYATTSAGFIDLGSFKFSIKIGRWDYGTLAFADYDFVFIANFKRIKEEVDQLVDKYLREKTQ